MTDKEILDLLRTDEGGGWQAVDPAIREKLLRTARFLLKRSPWIKLRDFQQLLRQMKEEYESNDNSSAPGLGR